MRLELDGFDAYWEEHGAGPPLVLIHGLGGSAAIWQKVAGQLAEEFRVIAYDLRGLGQSTTPPPPYTLTMLVADLHGLVEGLGLDRVALVGHSLGGAVALGYAAEHPERVSAVVGIAAPSHTPEEQRSMLAGRAESARKRGMLAIADVHAASGLPEAFKEAHPEETAVYKTILARGDPEGYAALCEVIADIDLTAQLGRIRAPVLLMQGALDRIVPQEAARETASRLAKCEYVQLEGCGHVIPFERPEELVARVREFVGRSAELAPEPA
jgi:3-oxoadipate enol-lactonase